VPARAPEEEISLGIAAARLRVGEHAALLYWTAEERSRGLVAAVTEGLRAADRIVYVGHDRALLTIERALVAAGVDPEARAADGSLALVTADDALFEGGVLDPDAALARLRGLVANAAGRRTRLIVEMTYLLAEVPGIERAPELEARLAEALCELQVVRICAFDAGREMSCRVADALRMFPTALHEGGAIRNPYYRPWSEARSVRKAGPLGRPLREAK
jgi:MEDS: MEthanogen/methylotroph, DcmR Sensory domain